MGKSRIEYTNFAHRGQSPPVDSRNGMDAAAQAAKLENGMRETAVVVIPFLGTALGAAMVFFMRQRMNAGLEKLLLGFASGVMIAASVWSLLIPAIDLCTERGKNSWFPASLGFLLGMGFLLLLDSLVPHIHLESGGREGVGNRMKKTTMLVMAVTLHNLPEGMAVGVTLAGAMMEETGITLAGAFALAIGIAIQNFPEGAIISMPLRNAGNSRKKSFWCGFLSGIVEPAGAVCTLLLAKQVVPVLPYLLAFAAGAMIYVVVEELIPESQAEPHSNIGTVGVAVGFVLMMILDVALS